jgi:hypothetical protein
MGGAACVHLELIQSITYYSKNKSPFDTCFRYLPPSPFDIVYGQQKKEAKVQGEERKGNIFVEMIQQRHLKV